MVSNVHIRIISVWWKRVERVQEMMPQKDPNEFTRILYGCDADEISNIVILTPIDSFLQTLKNRTSKITEFKGFNQGFKGFYNGIETTVLNSRIGSPVASDCVYYLRFTPCRIIIYVGLIGSLQPEIRIGDLILPTAANRGDGASQYFMDEAYPAVADFFLLEKLAYKLENVCSDQDINIYCGPIYTTDSFAAETREFLEYWGSQKLLGIDMETSAIYVIASGIDE